MAVVVSTSANPWEIFARILAAAALAWLTDSGISFGP